MKKILLALLLSSTLVDAQENKIEDKKENNLTNYVSLSLSTSNTNENSFSDATYYSIESGVQYENVSAGLAFGRNSLNYSYEDNLSNYWVELKSNVYQPLTEKTSLFLVFGFGNYLDTKDYFIEYGLGFTFNPNLSKLNYSLSYSNWDGVNYVSPGVSYNFN